MKLVTEYLADAAKFDHLADLEQDPKVREHSQAKRAAVFPKTRRAAAERIWRHNRVFYALPDRAAGF
jgi:hypothetical protein